jgi:hypothetical protein
MCLNGDFARPNLLLMMNNLGADIIQFSGWQKVGGEKTRG